MSRYPRLQLLLIALSTLSPVATLAEEEGRSEADSRNDSSRSTRMFRRIIFSGAMTNTGIEGSGLPRYSRTNGYAAGILFDLFGTGDLVLESGVIYRQLGATIDFGVGSSDFTASYISVPASLKYYLSGQEHTSLYLKAGIQGSTLISGSQIYTSPITRVGARSWETSFLAGLGLKLDLSPISALIAEVDYSRSVDSLFPDLDFYRSDISGVLGVALSL